MIENPFETIASEPPETEESEGASAPRGSVVPVYQCPFCEGIFGIDEYESLEVYFGVELIDCPCGCNEYSWQPSYSENAWKCKNGCFVHDCGVSPKHSSLRGYLCTGGSFYRTEEEAICCSHYVSS